MGATGAASWEVERLARVAAGDDSALADLYDQYAPIVYGVARRIVGGDDGLAADATQEVFVGLWQRPESYDAARGSLRAYLSVMARRRALDLLRLRARQERKAERAALEPLATPPNVEEAAAAMLVGEELRRAVDTLPPAQREAIELAYYCGLPYTEVAVRLGIPEGTAKSRLRLALARLGAAMRDQGIVQWA